MGEKGETILGTPLVLVQPLRVEGWEMESGSLGWLVHPVWPSWEGAGLVVGVVEGWLEMGADH
jgi:hypothetical protein